MRGIFSSLFSPARKNVAFQEEFWPDFIRRARSGQVVTHETALQTMAVLACVRVLSNGVAQVPFKLFQKSGDERKEATGHPVFDLLHRRPNEWQTSFEYRETIMLHLLLAGNHYSFKNVVNRKLMELIPLEPGNVTVKREVSGRLRYLVQGADGKQEEFPQEAIWHIRGPSWNSWLGMDAVKLAREAIGLSLATEAAHADLHANGAWASGTYSVDGTLDEEQHKKLEAWIKKSISGPNRGAPLVLDHAAKWLQQSMSGVDAQHLETRRFQVEEVARGLGVIPMMIGVTEKTATYASAEQMFIAHVVHGLAPHYERIEQSADVNLLTKEDRQAGFYTKFNADGLMRGAAKDRAEFLWKIWSMGAINSNEVRELLDRNPYDEGSIYRVPSNTMAVEKGSKSLSGGEDPGVEPPRRPSPN
ncbi:phage portal protein [Nisaea sediminum]|uniref:phage portal protein n=1 Tax=Nisaea sediminum TaxID=2775867 RepID=UPI001868EC33|nr:phage portal protein [Nisaea sediminum]